MFSETSDILFRSSQFSVAYDNLAHGFLKPFAVSFPKRSAGRIEAMIPRICNPNHQGVNSIKPFSLLDSCLSRPPKGIKNPCCIRLEDMTFNIIISWKYTAFQLENNRDAHLLHSQSDSKNTF